MFGLKNLEMDKLTTAFMVVSAAMIVFALTLAPADSAPIAAFGLWILGALILIGVWIAVGIEISKRFFGSGTGHTGADERTASPDEHNSPV